MTGSTPPLALTMGDPAGIGLEIAMQVWLRRSELGLAPFAMFADPDTIAQRARLLKVAIPVASLQSPAAATATFATHLPVVPVRLARPCTPGQPDGANSQAVIAAIELAVAAVVAGEARALVTNPIAKSVLGGAGFAYPGHTEFLAALAERQAPGRRHHPVMMLACDELRVVPLTIHIPLSSVPGAITPALIIAMARITHEALRRDFAVASPRLAVTGLNPHAGESGTMGREEVDVIGPAIAELRSDGLNITGPHSADTLFHAEARCTYDAVLAMYHDQALIPLKTLAFDRGVNVTLGLPFVRTSPDHGTAFDIAGAGRASPNSLIAALQLADQIAGRRAGARP